MYLDVSGIFLHWKIYVKVREKFTGKIFPIKNL